MKKITKTTIASIAAIVFSFGCLAQATATTITLSSKGIINSPGADGVEGTADDIVFDSRDLVTLKNNIESAETSVTNGKNALRTEINNNVSDANKLPTTGTPTFDDLVAKISKIREKGREDVVQAPQTYLPAGSQKAAQTYTPSTSNQVINAGQYLTGAQTILGDTDLVAGNIKSGVNLFGITGTYITPQTGTFTPNSSQVNLTAADMGATNTNRYVNTATCYSAGRTSVWNEIKSKGGNYSDVDTLAKLNDAINADNISYTREYLQSLGGIEIINQTGFNGHGNGNCETCNGARNQFTVPIGIARAYDIYLAPVTSGWNGVNVTVSAGNKGDWGYSALRPKLTFNNGSQYNTFNSIPQYQYSKLNVDFDNTINRNQIGDYGYIMIYIQADTTSNLSMMDMSIQLVPKS